MALRRRTSHIISSVNWFLTAFIKDMCPVLPGIQSMSVDGRRMLNCYRWEPDSVGQQTKKPNLKLGDFVVTLEGDAMESIGSLGPIVGDHFVSRGLILFRKHVAKILKFRGVDRSTHK